MPLLRGFIRLKITIRDRRPFSLFGRVITVSATVLTAYPVIQPGLLPYKTRYYLVLVISCPCFVRGRLRAFVSTSHFGEIGLYGPPS